ncbi:hypothetical protein NLJ89_g8723 [Agrocybe chaxingu]|uniref:Uncharacterized protein n=1 Tax=Agrocybe chaxingu TaxID=84603 RepID=A0A9W8K1A4_9AGAR|nr:hypothetical protein NLJ89_g8723 [Agrocybe chaxingu]
MANGHQTRPEVISAHMKIAEPIKTSIDLSSLPSTQPAYTAKRQTREELAEADMTHTAEELITDGFRYVPWENNGVRLLVAGDEKKVFGAVVGQPKGDSWREAVEAVTQLMLKEGAQANFAHKEQHHRRGHFPATNVGTTHSQSSEEPFNLNNGQHSGMVERLLADENVQRVAAFASASFRLVAPRIYSQYKTTLDKLFEKMPLLRRIFPKSVFPTCAFNFGPRVCTSKHRDVLNCPYGLCAIQALGYFDSTKGGHVILWEPKLIIELPPGAIIFIPSAVITHSNTPVRDGEIRLSFTQYCPGGLIRFVDHGFRLERDIKANDKKYYAEICRERPYRWKKALSLLSTLSELRT